MVNKEALDKIEEPLQKYKYNWGREIDLNYMPSGMSQEKLMVVLERIVETGESVLVGWNKCFRQSDINKQVPIRRCVPGWMQ